MRVEIELNKVIKDNYKVVRNNDFDGTINIVLIPKKRNCKACGKQFQSNGSEVIYYKGNNNESLFGYFCKKHFIEAKELLKDLK